VGERAERRAAGWRVPSLTPRSGRRRFIAGLGIGQIASWGTLYYSFPLIAEQIGQDLGLTQPEVYGAATIGLLIASISAYPIGTAIDRGHGRTIMALGSGLAGLLLLVWSQIGSLWALYPLLIEIGLAQAMTLYEPAFAVVARRYSSEARRGITALTLWGGFASTVFVPLIQFLLNELDWRSTLIVLGAINLAHCIPLYLAAIDGRVDARPAAPPPAAQSEAPLVEQRTVRWALHPYEVGAGLVARTKVLAKRPTNSALLASSRPAVQPVALAGMSATV
jgi:MFS family permease